MKFLKTTFLNLWRTEKNLPPNPQPQEMPQPTTEQKPEEKQENKKNKYLQYFSITAIALFAAVFLYFYPDGKTRNEIPVVLPGSQGAAIGVSSPFDGVILEAKAAFVFDVLENAPLFELNSDAQLPLASLAKIMTAIIAEENLPANLIVKIHEEAVLEEGDTGFRVGDEWPISELKDIMLLVSSNDAAFAVAHTFNNELGGDFVSLMNAKAKEIGLSQTYFLNPTGLDLSKNAAGAYGSAQDVAKMLLYAVEKHYPLVEITRFDKFTIGNREFENTDKIVNDLPGFIAGKTGFSDLAGGNLAVATDLGYGHPIIIVVLGSTAESRFNDVKTLHKAAISAIMEL